MIRRLTLIVLCAGCAGEPAIHESPGGGTETDVVGFAPTDAAGAPADGVVAGEDATTQQEVVARTDTGPCTATCLGKHCGDDGCGGSCGQCPSAHTCVDNVCHADCEPNCSCDLPETLSAYGAHVITLALPAQAANFGCDANGDGDVNDADGDVNSLLETAAAAGFDASAELAAQIAEGKLVLLLELSGYSGGDTSGFDANLLVGLSLGKQPDPNCNDQPPAGGCQWVVDPDSYPPPPNACQPHASLANASVSGGNIEAGPSSLSIPISLGGALIDLALTNATMTGTIEGMFSLTQGRLCGQVPKGALVTALDEACADPEPPDVCASKDLIAAVLTCDQCSVVFEIEAVPVLGMTVGAPGG